jgi:pyruvate formate lyase activating enzyme
MRYAANFPLESISPFTLLDYPDKTACILWFAGCNMKCTYCYNPEIVFSNGKLDYQQALDFLGKRKGLLDAVVFSGGECTRAKGFIEFVEVVKKEGFLVKIDTNGSVPTILDRLLEKNIIDYVALDFKSPANSFFEITQSKLFGNFERSLDLLLKSDLNFEVRTTFHDQLLSLDDINGMIQFLVTKGYKKSYYIQHFMNETETIGKIDSNTLKLKESDFVDSELKVILRN